MRIRIDERVEMRPEPFARDEVLQPITIDIAVRRAMQLRKDHAARIFRREVRHDRMLDERSRPVSRFLLLEPRQSQAMRLQRRDDVIETVTVNVVHRDLCAARTRSRPASKRRGMIFPRRTFAFRLWTFALRLYRLFPPPERIQKIHTAVAVDVADAHAVIRPGPRFA